MRIARSRSRLITGLMTAVIGLAGAGELSGQHTKMPSTLRYGSGFFDVPAASVLPHMAITGTYSGFNVSVDQRVITDAAGRSVAFGSEFSNWMSDGSVAIGLFDRVELGASFQHFDDADQGGTMIGGFGRLAIVQPERNGVGLAVGAQFVSAPSFDALGRDDYQPPRLGFPDDRFYEIYDTNDVNGQPIDRDDVNTVFSPYVVGSLQLAGFERDWLPRHDFSFALGYGEGMFGGDLYSDGGGKELEFYSSSASKGWFTGAALHIGLGEKAILNLIGDYNGFDINAGAQLDYSGIRVGAFVLGANYREKVTEYRSAKFGVLASIALCPATGGLCTPTLIERLKPDTIQLPAPPPDTVIVTREVAPPLPTGTPTQLCLSTGESVQVMVTAQGDTLVGPNRVSVRTLRPGVVFAGAYAGNMQWFQNDEDVVYERRNYQKSGGEVRLDCANIEQVGEHRGVPLFADRGAARPIQTLYVPVRPGVWQPYQSLRRTRG